MQVTLCSSCTPYSRTWSMDNPLGTFFQQIIPVPSPAISTKISRWLCIQTQGEGSYILYFFGPALIGIRPLHYWYRKSSWLTLAASWRLHMCYQGVPSLQRDWRYAFLHPHNVLLAVYDMTGSCFLTSRCRLIADTVSTCTGIGSRLSDSSVVELLILSRRQFDAREMSVDIVTTKETENAPRIITPSSKYLRTYLGSALPHKRL